MLTDEFCDPFQYHHLGRQGIGVVQPQSGIERPLIHPSSDVRFLIADLQLNFDDPGLYGGTPFTPPFRIHWLYGIGCLEDVPDSSEVPSSSSSAVPGSMTALLLDGEEEDPDDGDDNGGVKLLLDGETGDFLMLHGEPEGGTYVLQEVEPETPIHAAEIIIVDADDRIVFNSAEADSFSTRVWGDRLQVYQWHDPRNGDCLLVVHTKWPENDSVYVPAYYPKDFYPVSAILDARAVNVLPKRVRSLNVVLDEISNEAVSFAGGYNVQLNSLGRQTRGLRRTERISFNAAPGSGLGTFVDCTAPDLFIRTINGVPPSQAGDFYLSATDCYFVRQPTRLVGTSPRRTMPQIALSPGNLTDDDLPHPSAGTSKELPGWPVDDDPMYAHLQFGNDCGPCCTCDDYVEVAEYLNEQHDRYAAVGAQLEAARTRYHELRAEWESSRECLHRYPIRLFLQPQLCPFLDVAVQFCNQTDRCITNLTIYIEFETEPEGGTGDVVNGYTFISGKQRAEGRRIGKVERYKLQGDWPVYSANWDSVPQTGSVYAKFRMFFANCGVVPPPEASSSSEPTPSESSSSTPAESSSSEAPVAPSSSQSEEETQFPYVITVRAWATYGEDDEPIEIIPLGSLTAEEAIVEATVALNCPASDEDTFNNTACV